MGGGAHGTVNFCNKLTRCIMQAKRTLCCYGSAGISMLEVKSAAVRLAEVFLPVHQHFAATNLCVAVCHEIHFSMDVLFFLRLMSPYGRLSGLTIWL